MSNKSQEPLRVSRPGKFEAEPRWVQHFYEAWLNGEAHEDDGQTAALYINSTDVQTFPELHGFYEVRLYEDDQGFVYGTLIPEPPPPLGERA